MCLNQNQTEGEINSLGKIMITKMKFCTVSWKFWLFNKISLTATNKIKIVCNA